MRAAGIHWWLSSWRCWAFTPSLPAAVWGTSRATPIAGAGHQASSLRETAVTVLLGGGSLAIVVAMALVLWGLCVWKA
ncbi:MAG: (hydroxyamino)benzene mutase [Gammaproteobacteria bacterium]|nr:(hydroxyamino)benzene mutase [Gammaproteobacteria bacterium]